MTIKELRAVASGEIYITAYDCDGPAVLLTNYLCGSGGLMSMEIVKLTPYNGLDFCAHIDIPPAVVRVLEKESNAFYNRG